MRAFGERAVADFAAAGTADAAGFADGEIREVVVQDEFLLVLAAGVGIEFLRVVAGAERGERDGLRFAAGRTSAEPWARGRMPTSLEIGRTTSKARPSRRLPLFKNQAADGFLLDVIKSVVDDEIGDFFRAEFFDELRADFVLDRLAGGFAGEFAGREQRGHETVAGELLGFLQEFRRGRCSA